MHLSASHFTAVALACLLAGPGLAQRTQPPNRQTARSDLFARPLYTNPDIARSLNLTRDQLGRLDQATRRIEGLYRDDINRLGGLGPDQRDLRRRQLMQRYNRDWMRAAEDVLNQRQLSRYRQLDLQSRGLGAFTDPDLGRRLNLTAEQRRRLEDLSRRHEQQMNDLRGRAGTDRTDALRRYGELQRQTNERLMQILDENQRRTWRGLTGEPYQFPPDFSTPSPRR